MQQPFKEEAVFQFFPKLLAHRKTSDVKREPTQSAPLPPKGKLSRHLLKKPPDALQLKCLI